MNGLEKIINSIITEAENEAEKIIASANLEADNVINKAKEQANEILSQSQAKDKKQYDFMVSSANGSARLIERQKILSAKHQLVDLVIKAMENKLLNLNDEEYFSMLYKISKTYSHKESGIILLNEKDKNRLPKDFLKKISVNGKLELSEEIADISGGFKLIYGGIEENCSFFAIIDSKREEITDMVASMLFGG